MRNLPRFFLTASIAVLLGASVSAADSTQVQVRSKLAQQLELAGAAEARADFPAARKIYEQAAGDFSTYAEAWAALGEHLRFYVHDASAATAAFQKSLAAENQDPNAAAFSWRGLGELEHAAHHDDAAVDYFKKSLAAFPLADTHRSLCHLYCRQRKFKEAAEQAGEAVKLNPDDAIARLLYAAQLYRAGETENARAEFDKAAAMGGIGKNDDPHKHVHCCVLYNAAGYLSVTGQNDAALAMLKRFFDTPNHRHLSREEIETDADFDKLKEVPAFRSLLDASFAADVPDAHSVDSRK